MAHMSVPGPSVGFNLEVHKNKLLMNHYRPKPQLLLLLQVTCDSKQEIFSLDQIDYLLRKYMVQQGMMDSLDAKKATNLSSMMKNILKISSDEFQFPGKTWLADTVYPSLDYLNEDVVCKVFPVVDDDGAADSVHQDDGVDVMDTGTGANADVVRAINSREFKVVKTGKDSVRVDDMKYKSSFDPNRDHDFHPIDDFQHQRGQFNGRERRSPRIRSKLSVSSADLRTLKNFHCNNAVIDDPGLCNICKENPKNASLVHGRTSHQYACLKCSQCLMDWRKPCPLCRMPIVMVVKVFES